MVMPGNATVPKVVSRLLKSLTVMEVFCVKYALGCIFKLLDIFLKIFQILFDINHLK